MALPAQFNTSTLTGKYVDILGNPLAGRQLRLTFAPEALVVASADTIVIPDVRVITLDVNGVFIVDIPDPTDPDVNPHDWTYQVEEMFGANRRYPIEFSGPGPHDMSDLSPVPSSAGDAVVVGPGVLAGGTTGQVLAKASPTDYDTAWSSLDAATAAVVTPGGSATAAALAADPALRAAFGSVRRDLREFVLPGETLDYTGATDASVIIQRGIDALTLLYAADGMARQLVAPPGRYRLTTQLYIEPGVGLLGSGRDETVLFPEAHQSGLTIRTINVKPADLGGAGKTYDDCHFADFTIDAVNQDNSTPSLSVKGIFLQWMKRGSFRRVAVKNTLGTGFGCDYLRDVTFDSCFASGCGRSASPGAGAGAGFGVATGWYDDEPVMLRNCVSVGNKTHGFFTECKWDGTAVYPAQPVKHSRGFSLIGCTASGNYEGFRDAGSSGAVVHGCSFFGNTGNGAAVGPTAANLTGGKDGRISQCAIYGNGIDGVVLDRMQVGGYTVENSEIYSNVRYGLNHSGALGQWAYPMTIQRTRIHDNGGSGMRFPTASESLNRLSLVENEVFDNGTDTALADRDGITIYNALTRPTVRGNRCYNTLGSAGPQQYGIWLRGTATSIEPVVELNDVRINAAGALRVDHTIADQTYVRSNILPGYAWSDSFTRADAATLGATETGDKLWQPGSSVTSGVASNQAYAYSADTTGRTTAVDSGSPTGAGTFTITLAVAGAQRRGRTVARGGGANSTTHIALLHRTGTSDFRYQIVTRSGTTDTLVSQLSALSADGDVHQIIQDAAGNVTVNINGTQVYTGNIPYATVPAGGRYGFGGTSGAGTDGTRFDSASFVPA